MSEVQYLELRQGYPQLPSNCPPASNQPQFPCSTKWDARDSVLTVRVASERSHKYCPHLVLRPLVNLPFSGPTRQDVNFCTLSPWPPTNAFNLASRLYTASIISTSLRVRCQSWVLGASVRLPTNHNCLQIVLRPLHSLSFHVPPGWDDRSSVFVASRVRSLEIPSSRALASTEPLFSHSTRCDDRGSEYIARG